MPRHAPWLALLVLSLLAGCTTPRPPLPDAGLYQPPPEANFDVRPDAIPFDSRYRYDPARFTPPAFLYDEPGSHAVSPRGSLGVSDAYIYFVIEKDGAVRQVKVIVKTGQPDYDESIARHVTHWHFKPGTLDGEPVAVATGYIFRLHVVPGH